MRLLGQCGEDLAAGYLEQQGFTILCRNFRYKRFEIDLIVEREGLIIFVEVKMRKNAYFGYPERFVQKKQAKAIHIVALHYLELRKMEGHPIRFDIIAILGSQPNGMEITHFQDSF